MSKEERQKNKNTTTENVNSPNSIWINTPLSKFGFKCVMNKHDLCADEKCQCLCHPQIQQG